MVLKEVLPPVGLQLTLQPSHYARFALSVVSHLRSLSTITNCDSSSALTIMPNASSSHKVKYLFSICKIRLRMSISRFRFHRCQCSTPLLSLPSGRAHNHCCGNNNFSRAAWSRRSAQVGKRIIASGGFSVVDIPLSVCHQNLVPNDIQCVFRKKILTV